MVGLIGALIILRPGFSDISFGTILALASALSLAGAGLFIKKMTETESASSIVFWMVMMQTPIAFVPMLFVWKWPSRRLGLSMGCGIMRNSGAHDADPRLCTG